MSDAPQVTDNAEASRFELTVDGVTAELAYRRRGDRLVLVHTAVPETIGGRGLGGQLVQAAIDRAADEGLTVVPLCTYARAWLERHPDAATVTPDAPHLPARKPRRQGAGLPGPARSRETGWRRG